MERNSLKDFESSKTPSFLGPNWSPDQGYSISAIPEAGQSIPNPCIRENGEMSRFLLCFFDSFGLKTGPLPCCLLSVDVFSENHVQQKLLKASSFDQIDFSAMKPNSCSKDIFALFQPLGHHSKLLHGKGPRLPISAGKKLSLLLAMEIFVLWPERKALSGLLLFLNENVLNHLFDDSSSRTGWSDD